MEEWLHYEIGEREALYRVSVGPTLADHVTRELRKLGLRVNAGTSDIYIVAPNLPISRTSVLRHVREFASTVTHRDITILP